MMIADLRVGETDFLEDDGYFSPALLDDTQNGAPLPMAALLDNENFTPLDGTCHELLPTEGGLVEELLAQFPPTDFFRELLDEIKRPSPERARPRSFDQGSQTDFALTLPHRLSEEISIPRTPEKANKEQPASFPAPRSKRQKTNINARLKNGIAIITEELTNIHNSDDLPHAAKLEHFSSLIDFGKTIASKATTASKHQHNKEKAHKDCIGYFIATQQNRDDAFNLLLHGKADKAHAAVVSGLTATIEKMTKRLQSVGKLKLSM
jgi:hypothetical protein